MENLLAGRVGIRDGHGGRAEEHRREMEATARKVFEEERTKWMEAIDEKILAAQYEAYE